MAYRRNAVKPHRFNDFWDKLVKDLDQLEKKAREEGIIEDFSDPKRGKESAFKVVKKTLWTDSQEAACWKRRLKRENTEILEERKKTEKALLIVRKEALRNLLAKEKEGWEEELSALGISLDRKRT